MGAQAVNPPPNPHAAEARAAMREAVRELLVNPPPATPRPLYPLDVPIPIWRHECHDDGVRLTVDDPATMFSGVEDVKEITKCQVQ